MHTLTQRFAFLVGRATTGADFSGAAALAHLQLSRLQPLGCAGLECTLVPGVPRAIDLLQRAGIRWVVCTGDSLTAATGTAATSAASIIVSRCSFPLNK